MELKEIIAILDKQVLDLDALIKKAILTDYQKSIVSEISKKIQMCSTALKHPIKE